MQRNVVQCASLIGLLTLRNLIVVYWATFDSIDWMSSNSFCLNTWTRHGIFFTLHVKKTDYATKTLLTSFCGSSVRRVLSSVAGNNFIDSIVTTQREVDFYDVITGLHQSQDSLHLFALLLVRGSLFHVFDKRILDNLTSTMEEIFNLDWKINIFGLITPQTCECLPCQRIWGFELSGCVGDVRESDDPSRLGFGSKQPAKFSPTPCWQSELSQYSWDDTFWLFTSFNTTQTKKDYREVKMRIDVARVARKQRMNWTCESELWD